MAARRRWIHQPVFGLITWKDVRKDPAPMATLFKSGLTVFYFKNAVQIKQKGCNADRWSCCRGFVLLEYTARYTFLWSLLSRQHKLVSRWNRLPRAHTKPAEVFWHFRCSSNILQKTSADTRTVTFHSFTMNFTQTSIKVMFSMSGKGGQRSFYIWIYWRRMTKFSTV